MALKFRRGTTAQKSGSLAFGEPYVNTTLGTLQIGLESGDATLTALGTGSNIVVAGISGSSLDITGNAKIDGNLTLGGQLTIGDATSDTVNVVASLSSSLIPQADSVYDLGSATKSWKELYVSTGSINFVANGEVVSTLSTNADGSQNFPNGVNVTGSVIVSGSNIEFTRDWPAVGTESHFLRVAPFTSSVGRYYDGIGIGVEHWNDDTGTYEHSIQIHSWDDHTNRNYGAELNVGPYRTHMRVYPSGSNGDYSNVSVQELPNGKTQALVYADIVQIGRVAADSILIGNSGSVVEISGSIRVNSLTGSIAATNGIVSGSSQITLSETNGFTTYSTSVDSRIATEKGRVDAILLSADADKDSFAEIVTLINSVDTTNDNAFASFYTASVGRLTNLESTSASVNTSVSNLNTFSSSALTRLSTLEVETANLEAFTSSINTTIKNRLDANNVISGSSQVTLSATTGYGSIINQALLTTSAVTHGNLTINGTITATGDITAFFTSDRRHKSNIQTITNALDKVKKLNGVTWEWNDDVNEVTKTTPTTGLIAQEVQEVLPQVVVERENGYLGLDYSKMMGLLVEAIKEQQIKIDNLTVEVEALKKKKGL
jgi:hypothetical protein